MSTPQRADIAIYVDQGVYLALVSRARPGETKNATLRRILGLDNDHEKGREGLSILGAALGKIGAG